MSHLCFGSFASLIKNATPLSKSRVVDLLVKGLGSNISIDTSDKSKLINSKLDLQYLKDSAGTIGISDSIEKYFSKEVVIELTKLKINELIELLKITIMKDDSIVTPDKNFLLTNADKEHLSEFLSKVFLFATTRPNDYVKNPLPVINSSDNIIAVSEGKIFLNGEEIPLPKKLVPPKELDNNEAIYIAELLKTYAEKQKVQAYSINDIPNKYKNEIDRHRQDFYNAEAVHRKVREIYSSDENDFDLLKNETYDGIIDTHSMSYSNGYERLLHVLEQAVKLQDGKSLLWKLPKWIGSSEKKGICHILVNENRLTWVVKDE